MVEADGVGGNESSGPPSVDGGPPVVDPREALLPAVVYKTDIAPGLAPLLQKMLERNQSRPRLIDLPLQQMRDVMASDLAGWAITSPSEVVFSDLFLSGDDNRLIRVRRYSAAKPMAASSIVHAHGGGWVMGAIETHDAFCRELCAETDLDVLSVNYSLAPEYPFPSAIHDMLAVCRNLEGSFFLAGDSAGAQIALDAALRMEPTLARRCRGLVSIYGAFDPKQDTDSHRLFGDGCFGLSSEAMRVFWAAYTSKKFGSNYKAPWESDLSGLPKTLLVAAGLDCLLDDTLRLADALVAQNRDHTLMVADGLVHGFIHMTSSVPEARDLVVRLAEWVRTHA